MDIRVDTSKFETSHMRKPRGWGEWMFEFEGYTYTVRDAFNNACMQAKKAIRQDHAGRTGVAYMVVCP